MKKENCFWRKFNNDVENLFCEKKASQHKDFKISRFYYIFKFKLVRVCLWESPQNANWIPLLLLLGKKFSFSNEHFPHSLNNLFKTSRSFSQQWRMATCKELRGNCQVLERNKIFVCSILDAWSSFFLPLFSINIVYAITSLFS